MKPVFKCDGCSFMGTAEEVEKHEQTCEYLKKACSVCGNCDSFQSYKENRIICRLGDTVPAGQMFVNCIAFIPRTEANIFPDLFNTMRKK